MLVLFYYGWQLPLFRTGQILGGVAVLIPMLVFFVSYDGGLLDITLTGATAPALRDVPDSSDHHSYDGNCRRHLQT